MGEDNTPDADGDFSNAPILNFNDDRLKFDTNWFDNANDNYGSVSAFLPKSLLRGRRHPQGCLLSISARSAATRRAFGRFHLLAPA